MVVGGVVSGTGGQVAGRHWCMQEGAEAAGGGERQQLWI